MSRFWNTNQDLESCHRSNLEDMPKWPYGCPAEIWKGTSQEADKRNKHASHQMRPDTACNLRSVKKNKQKNVVKQPFRNDSSLGYSSNLCQMIHKLRYDIWRKAFSLFSKKTQESIFLYQGCKRKLHQDGHEGWWQALEEYTTN